MPSKKEIIFRIKEVPIYVDKNNPLIPVFLYQTKHLFRNSFFRLLLAKLFLTENTITIGCSSKDTLHVKNFDLCQENLIEILEIARSVFSVVFDFDYIYFKDQKLFKININWKFE